MAKICCCWFNGTPLQLTRNHGVEYKNCSNSINTPKNRKSFAIFNRAKIEQTETPQVLKIAVTGITELLRLFSPSPQTRCYAIANYQPNLFFFTYHQHIYYLFSKSHFYFLICSTLSTDIDGQFPVSSIDDVLMIIKSDYDNAYFVTGNFTSSIYAENCSFEDPTIQFRGRDLYARNLKLLVPFFDCASIVLLKIEKDVDSDTNYLRAFWKLRTNLKLPWRPLIAIDGRTFYELNEDFKIVRHVESWNVSALEAILQIFTFKFRKSGG